MNIFEKIVFELKRKSRIDFSMTPKTTHASTFFHWHILVSRHQTAEFLHLHPQHVEIAHIYPHHTLTNNTDPEQTHIHTTCAKRKSRCGRPAG